MMKRSLKPSLARSFFLFGPRSTGKSTLMREFLSEKKALWIDLLDPELERDLARNPNILGQMIEQSKKEWVVIDEVQKIPDLLSIAQQFIQRKKIKFALTGSSARKLKRGAANLLGGRASLFHLYSLTAIEMGEKFALLDALAYGTLPELVSLEANEKVRLLKSYSSAYLKEEVVAEQLVRKVQPFRNFLELAAIQNGQILNYSNFARDCGVDVTTIQTYFEILEDTLIGFILPPFHLSIRKRQRKNPKFYFFDVGVARALAGNLDEAVKPRTQSFGRLFEHFVILEIVRHCSYAEKSWKFSYLTSRDGAEINLVVELGARKLLAIEIKSSSCIDEREVKAFERIAGGLDNARLLFLSLDPKPQKIGQVECLPWQKGLKEIFDWK